MALEATDVLRDRSVLVTGSSGFIGGHLCRRLIERRALVHAVSRRRRPAQLGVTAQHAIDLADAGAVRYLVQSIAPDCVIHLASHVSGARSIDVVLPTFQSNLASTVNLLTSLTNTKCRRIVLAGSLEETPRAAKAAIQTEAPSSPYAAAKSAASLYAAMFWQLYKTPVTTARLFMVYGPNQPDEKKLVPYVTLSLLSGQRPQLTSGARPVDWVYVDDVVDALIACAITPGLEGRTIDVGTGQLTTVRSVAERIGKLVGKGEPVFGTVEDRVLEQVRAADVSQTTTLLGRPLTNLEEGLKRTIDWYRQREDASPAR